MGLIMPYDQKIPENYRMKDLRAYFRDEYPQMTDEQVRYAAEEAYRSETLYFNGD